MISFLEKDFLRFMKTCSLGQEMLAGISHPHKKPRVNQIIHENYTRATSSDQLLMVHLRNSLHKKGVKLQFDRIFGKIYYAKTQYLRTFREFCSNTCRSGIRKMKIKAEWSLIGTKLLVPLES